MSWKMPNLILQQTSNLSCNIRETIFKQIKHNTWPYSFSSKSNTTPGHIHFQATQTQDNNMHSHRDLLSYPRESNTSKTQIIIWSTAGGRNYTLGAHDIQPRVIVPIYNRNTSFQHSTTRTWRNIMNHLHIASYAGGGWKIIQYIMCLLKAARNGN